MAGVPGACFLGGVTQSMSMTPLAQLYALMDAKQREELAGEVTQVDPSSPDADTLLQVSIYDCTYPVTN